MWTLASATAAATAVGSEQTAPVVLELFTSQGCSSCPAAEDLLSRIGLDPGTRSLVVPLAYHVDYWNELGWRDPFSDRAWSFRQAQYQHVLKVADGVYTPQLVVNGQAELNGTHAKRVLGEIDAALRRRVVASIEVAARLAETERPTLAVDVTATMLDDVDARKLELRLAVFENGLLTAVGRGENRGRTLRNDFIVRRLDTAFSLQAAKGARGQRQLTLKLDRDWSPENLGVAAFLQDPRSLRILAAAARQLSGSTRRSSSLTCSGLHREESAACPGAGHRGHDEREGIPVGPEVGPAVPRRNRAHGAQDEAHDAAGQGMLHGPVGR